MPAGPAPITATRRGLFGVGSPSSGTVAILTRAGRAAPAAGGSDAAVVAVERVRHVLGERHPAAWDQRCARAARLRLLQRDGTGEPAVAPDQVARRRHAADDHAPLVVGGVEADATAAGEQVVGHALERGPVACAGVCRAGLPAVLGL